MIANQHSHEDKGIPAVMEVLLLAIGFSSAHADGNEKLEFVGHIEEILGHFWAIEKNLMITMHNSPWFMNPSNCGTIRPDETGSQSCKS